MHIINQLILDENSIQDLLEDDLLFNEFFEELECDWEQEVADNSIRDTLPDDNF